MVNCPYPGRQESLTICRCHCKDSTFRTPSVGPPFARRKNCFYFGFLLGVFHLPRNSGNSGWDVNGTHVFGSFHWKISGINGTSEKVVLFSRWKLSDGNVCSIYNF